MAVGVVLVLIGLLSLHVAPATGEQPRTSSRPAAEEPGSPLDTPGASASRGSDQPPVIATLPPASSPTLPSAPPATLEPSASFPPSSRSPSPTISGPPSARPTLPSGEDVVASRVRVPSLRIDLPVVSGDLQVAGNRGNYPLCDVAQFLTAEGFVQPSEAGTTYLYAHAREGMFLSLLEASQRDNGRQMLGALVQVYTGDGRVFLYEIFQVKRHATDFSLALELPEGEQRLVLQTSEGPSGTIPKLQVAARLLNITQVSGAVANPPAQPRACP